MATKITQTCDQCSTDVSDYHLTRAIAFNNGARLSFHAWSDKLAQEPKALHFHNDLCAKRFLENWLSEQRLKEEAPVVPAVKGWVEDAPVQESEDDRLARNIHELGKGSVQEAVVDAEWVEEPKIVDGKVVACNCWRNGDPFAAPEAHAASCPESLQSRRREIEEAKPYAEAQAVEHPSEEPL